MIKFIAGFLLGLAVLPVFVFLYFRAGYAPVATSEPPMPFEKSLARAAVHARIQKEMPTSAPVALSDTTLAAGARIYREHCAFCHGLPGQPANATAKGMFPKPPQLFVRMITHDPPGEIYWKVANGIRLTGMPGYASSLPSEQIWQVSLMLANANRVPAAALALGAHPAP